jgi:hypothetical protein
VSLDESRAPARDDDRAPQVAHRPLPHRPHECERQRVRVADTPNSSGAAISGAATETLATRRKRQRGPGFQWADNGIAALSAAAGEGARRPCQPWSPLRRRSGPWGERPHPGRQARTDDRLTRSTPGARAAFGASGQARLSASPAGSEPPGSAGPLRRSSAARRRSRGRTGGSLITVTSPTTA